MHWRYLWTAVVLHTYDLGALVSADDKVSALILQYAVTNLPLVDWHIPNSWAGELPIGKNYGNDTLFFWLWEAENSFASDHLIIWLQGGPACSSLLGLFKENGPILFKGNSQSPVENPYSWTKLANVLYVDQPVGTGFSYGNESATDNAGDTAAFVMWLESFFNIFPSLKSKKIHLMGESFAGIFIPYIAQALIVQQHTLEIKIASIGLGDSTWGNAAALTDVVTTTFIKQHAHDYGVQMTPAVLDVLERADVACGFNTVLSQLTYPPPGKISIPGNPENDNYKLKSRQTSATRLRVRQESPVPPGYNPDICDFANGTHTAAQMSFLINGTDPNSCYGNCATYDSAYTYFVDAKNRCFNPYNIDTKCGSTLYSDDAYMAYLNLPAVKAAIHAPQWVLYESCNADLEFDLSAPDKKSTPPAYYILPSLLEVGIEVNLWSGALDYVIIPLGQELCIQNMTWNGAQGLSSPPNIPFYDQNGAGHRVPQDTPGPAFTFVQNIVVKQNTRRWSRRPET